MLLPTLLLAASGLTVSEFASVAFGQEESKTEAKKQDDAKKEKPKTGRIGRGRLSGNTPPPKPASVPKTRGLRNATKGTPKPITNNQADVGAKVQKPGNDAARKAYEAKQKALGNQPNARSAAPRPPKNPNAKLELDFGLDKHDFGKARQGEQLTHTFMMKSGGTEPLIISQASPTCGCTLGELKVRTAGADVAELYQFGDPIAPGDSIELSATLDTTSKRNKTNVRINIYSNDGLAGQTQLQLQANVEPFIVATPQFLQIGDVREGVERTATVDFRTSGGERINLSRDETRPVPLPAGLTVDLVPMNADEEGKSNHWRATFKIAGDSPEGPKGHLLRLVSDVKMPESKAKKLDPKLAAKKASLPTHYTADANISYRILGALSLQPQYVSFGLVRPGQVVVRSVRMTSHEPEFDLSNVKVEITGEGDQPLQWSDKFVATVKPASGTNAVDIEVRLTGLPDEADGSFRGRVKIQTGHAAKPEMDFRFSGVCRKLSGAAKRPSPAELKDAAKQKKADGSGR